MRIGLTYDLREDYAGRGLSEEALAEFDSPETVDALETALAANGHEVDRIGHVQPRSQRLVRVTRLAGNRFEEEDLGGVAFVPLIGAQGWQPDLTGPARPARRRSAKPPSGAPSPPPAGSQEPERSSSASHSATRPPRGVG